MGARSPGPLPPLFLDQTEAWRAQKKIFETGLPPLSQGLNDQAPALSEGLDQPLTSSLRGESKGRTGKRQTKSSYHLKW